VASFVLDEDISRRPAREDIERAGFKVEQISIEIGAGEHFDDERIFYLVSLTVIISVGYGSGRVAYFSPQTLRDLSGLGR
jgi:hypothetical protein